MRRAAMVAMLAVNNYAKHALRARSLSRALLMQANWTTQLNYTMGQATKFVPYGSCRSDSTDNPDILIVASKDPNGSLVLIAHNDTATSQT